MGNPVNWTDPTGLFSCSGEGVLSPACEDLNTALMRADNGGLALSAKLGAGQTLDYQLLKVNAQTVFGVRFGLFVDKDKIPNMSCDNILSNKSAKYSLLTSIAAMAHVVSAFQEAYLPQSLELFRTHMGQNGTLRFQFNSNLPDATGETPEAYPGQVFLGLNNELKGTYFPVSTIVHELGHAFDRNFQYRPSKPLKLLQIRKRGAPTYDPDTNTTNILSAFDNGNGGVLTRAAAKNMDDPKELWADMFMTWVFDGYNRSSPPQSINSWRGPKIGWQVNRIGFFGRSYTNFAIQCLMTGECNNIQFPSSGTPQKGYNPYKNPEDPFVKLIVGISRLSGTIRSEPGGTEDE